MRWTELHRVRQIGPGLWQIVFFWPAATNCWLLQDDDGLTLIDAGYPWSGAAVLNAVKQIGESLKRIVITHAHPDHAGAAAEISQRTGATVLAHNADTPYLKGGEYMCDQKGSWLCCTVLRAGKLLGILNAPAVSGVKSLEDGQFLGQLQVLHTPGHTPGSISLWSGEKKALFSGDNICSSFAAIHIGLPWFTLDATTQRSSLQKYADLPAELLLPGHGDAFQGDVRKAVKRLL